FESGCGARGGPRPAGGRSLVVSERARAAVFRFAGPLALGATLRPLHPRPGFDPTPRTAPAEAVRATVPPEGPATAHLLHAAPGVVHACAWGPGAEWALARVPDLLGLEDPPWAPPPGAPPRLREIAR